MHESTGTLSVTDDQGDSGPGRSTRPHLTFVYCADRLDLLSRRFLLPREGSSAVIFGRARATYYDPEAPRPERAGDDDEALRSTRHAGLPDARMSTRHARIRRDRGAYRIEDLGSKNGSLVNGVVVNEPCRLTDGDIVELGHSFFVFRDRTPTWEEGADEPRRLGDTDLSTLYGPYAERLIALDRVAQSDLPIVILGETGVGKEVVAKAIHRSSRRRGALVAVNCGALPEALVESELFGAVKGAFSGAIVDRPGLVRAADEGTLFLDEIGELPKEAQVKLLRVLQEGTVIPVGGTQPIAVDFRVLSATHRNLQRDVDADKFRQDLLARLSGYTFEVPPLRDRTEDLGLLLREFVTAQGKDLDRVALSRLVARRLLLHRWPFNVRELEKAITVALTLAEDRVLKPEHLALGESARAGDRPAPPSPPPKLTPQDEERRRQLIALLQEHGGNISEVARSTGKARMQIHRWLKRYAIDPRRPGDATDER